MLKYTNAKHTSKSKPSNNSQMQVVFVESSVWLNFRNKNKNLNQTQFK